MEFTSSAQKEETKDPRDQSASAVRPRTAVRLKPRDSSRTPVRMRTGAPCRTAVLLTPKASTRTQVPLSEVSSTTQVLSKPEPRTQGPLSEEPSRTELPLKDVLTSTQVSWDSQGFWTVDASAELGLQALGILAAREDSSSPPTSYFRLISNFLKPERPTEAVMGLIEMTVEVMKLDHQVKETQIQQKLVMEETELLLNKILPIQAEVKVMLANLTNTTREYRKEIENQWNICAQESDETSQTTQELASNYEKRTSELLTTQFPEKEELEPDLEQQLEAVRGVSLVRETQQRELQTLQEELKKARAQTAAKAHAWYLQEKAALEKQLSEPALSTLGKRQEEEMKRKAQALEVAAERHASEFHRLLAESQELQLHKELEWQRQLCRQCQEEKTSQSWLKILKQQPQQEQLSTKHLFPERKGLRWGALKNRRRSSLAAESIPSNF